MKRIAVCHPRAARSRGWQSLQEMLGGDLEVRLTEGPGHARDLAREAAPEAGQVLAVGGDGTVQHVVNGLLEAFPPEGARKPPPLGVVPLGTGNDFARSLGLPLSPQEQAACLRNGLVRTLDMGRAKVIAGEDWRTLYFTGSISVGFGAAVVERTERAPKMLPGTLSYLLSLLTTLVTYRGQPGMMMVDGGERPTKRLFNLNLCNTKYYGGGMISHPDAVPDDGHLDLVLMELTPLGVIKALPETYRGNFDKIEGVWLTPCHRLRVEAPEGLPVQADGEVVGTTPIIADIVPSALHLVVPATQA